jgi:serine/threonine-protein phosphatase 2A regulatory subunit B
MKTAPEQQAVIKPLKWTFTNGYGERDRSKVTEQDILSSLAFDQTGDYIAVGDKGGRVILFKKAQSAAKGSSKAIDYSYFSEFQSHESEFDELKSIEIEEKINRIEWLNRHYRSLFLLTTNDKKIKLWKVYNKEEKKAYGLNLEGGAKGIKALKIPKLKKGGKVVTAQFKKSFQNAHDYHINSISQSADNEHFLSADDLRVNIWNLSISNEVYSAVDIPVENMEDLSEVITSASFHPTDPNVFMFSSSKGVIKLCDFRVNSQYDKSAVDYMLPEDSQKRNFFSEIINSISYACFAKNGNYLFSRDYITVKAWDVRKNRTPLANLRLCAYLERKLCDLYESENIFDKFELCSSPDSQFMLTGTYTDSFHVVDRQGNSAVTLSASFENPKGTVIGTVHTEVDKKPPTLASFDFSRKIQQAAWHPSNQTIAVANHNCLYVFNGS